MEQPHRSPLIEHFINAQDPPQILLPKKVDGGTPDPITAEIDCDEQQDDDDASDDDGNNNIEEAGTELLLSAPEEDPQPLDAEDEEVFSLDDVTEEDEDAAEDAAEDAGVSLAPATLDVEGTAAVEAPVVVPAELGVREEQGRVWLEVPSDASTASIIAGMEAVSLSGGVLWLSLGARPTTAAEVGALAEAAVAALGRPVAGVKVFRGGLADGLRQETGLTVEIDGDAAEKPSAESRGRQVLVVERTLRSGTSTRFRGDILVYGDVNAGAEVEAAGNIVVLGTLRGVAWAGSGGDDSAQIISFDLRPTQVRIGRRIAFLPERPRGRAPRLPEVALVCDDEIVLREYRGRLG